MPPSAAGRECSRCHRSRRASGRPSTRASGAAHPPTSVTTAAATPAVQIRHRRPRAGSLAVCTCLLLFVQCGALHRPWR
jgi:hypothetical protein